MTSRLQDHRIVDDAVDACVSTVRPLQLGGFTRPRP